MNMAMPRSVYVTGILLGIPALVIAAILTPLDSLVVALVTTGMIFVVFGFIAGVIAPTGRWRSGATVAVPLILLLLLSVAFVGQGRSFLVHDALIPITALVFGAIGGALGGKLRRQKANAV